MKMRRIITLAAAGLTGVRSTFAQSCAMCYDSAAQQGPEAARALNTGILVLLLPALLLFAGVIITASRRAGDNS
jgi:hypothetical protein